MKTKTLRKTVSRTLKVLALVIGIGLFNTAWACTTNFTYIVGANGHVSFSATYAGYTFTPSFTWNPGDGRGTMYGQFPSHVYIANGTYKVLLTTQDSLCTDTISMMVTVSNVTTPCTLSAAYTWVNGLDGQVKFTSTSTGTNAGTLYFWNFGDGTPEVQAGDTVTHKYIYSKYYFPWLVVKDTGSAYCIDSTNNYVTILNGDSNSCSMLHTNFTYTAGSNGHYTFNSTSVGVAGGAKFYWDAGDGSGRQTTVYSGTFSHIFLTNGTFNVKMAVFQNDSVTCQDSTTIPVTVTNVDTAAPCNLNANFSISIDSNGQVKFTSTSTGTHPFTQYSWQMGDSTATIHAGDTITYRYAFLGTYNVTLTIQDTGSAYCTSSVTIPVNIYNRDSLEARFVYSADSLVAGEYHFTSTSKGTNSNTYYRWDPGDGNPADSGLGMTTYTHTYAHNGPYSATLTVWYTIIPKVNSGNRVFSPGRYSESSYTLVVNVANNPSGIATISDASGQFNLYPNPNNGQYRISVTGLAQNQKTSIVIINMLGEVMYNTTTETSGNKLVQDINMQSVPQGIYLVKVVAGNNIYTTKLVIER